MRILKEKLIVRMRASGFDTIILMRDSCVVFVLFFLLNLFLTAQNINGFYFFRSGWCWPIRALPISILLLSVLCNGVLFKGFLLCVVLFCFSSQFVFDSTKHSRFLLFRSGWCWPLSILYEHFGDRIPLHWTGLRKKKNWVNDVFSPNFLHHILILCLTFQLCQFSP